LPRGVVRRIAGVVRVWTALGLLPVLAGDYFPRGFLT
jgi:hypothetical protein